VVEPISILAYARVGYCVPNGGEIFDKKGLSMCDSPDDGSAA
jgi:hypothetical protein